MHAKIAASRGLFMSMDCWNFSRISAVKGSRLARLDDVGTSLLAPLSMALYSHSWIFHSSPCKVCHALKAAAKFAMVEPECVPAQLERKAEKRMGEIGVR